MKGICVITFLLSVPLFVARRAQQQQQGINAEEVCPPITSSALPPKDQCEGHGVIRSFKIEEVVPSNLAPGETPPVEIGTDENMCMHPELDFTGIWWMSSHPEHTWKGEAGGNALDEYLVSWAGAVVDSKTDFPVHMTAPTSHAGHWTWGSGMTGRFLMNYYAQTSNHSEHQRIKFFNSTMAEIKPVADALESSRMYLVIKKSEDEWVRANYAPMEGQTMEEAKFIYTLVRIVRQDGSPTKFFNDFLEYMHDTRNFKTPFAAMPMMQAWNTNDDCMRKCEIGYSTGWKPCRLCAWQCR